MTPLQEKALALLDKLQSISANYEYINSQYKKLQGDFPCRIQAIDTHLEDAVVSLIDSVLGDELGSYFLYETPSMIGGGKIVSKEGVTYRIQTVEDIRFYLEKSEAETK